MILSAYVVSVWNDSSAEELRSVQPLEVVSFLAGAGGQKEYPASLSWVDIAPALPWNRCCWVVKWR